jgi:glycosyltransferase involved in cell wall biosynthesis
MQDKRILIIGLVWPEPTSSAAGSRMVQLIELFVEYNYQVTFACAAGKSEYSHDLPALGVTEQPIKLNDERFNTFIKDYGPCMVLFDRYMVEEQYGWRVQQECPDALRLLDTEDLHCLRAARSQAIKKAGHLDQLDFYNDTAKREIASILRCDLSLIISEVEMELLAEKYHISEQLLYYLPFLETPITENDITAWTPFEQREGFMFIGNYLHEPNWHTVQILKNKIWPLLRKLVPEAKMHIYGAYAGQKVMQLHNEKEKFFVHGRAKNAQIVMSIHKLLIAPIQFGAGVKGKFIDAMQSGTPTVTTAAGAEAMSGTLPWNGTIVDDHEGFVTAAQALYQDKTLWEDSRNNGVVIINTRYAKDTYAQPFIDKLEGLVSGLKLHRENNFFGQILQHQTVNSLKYMSLWIEEKNKQT